MKILFTDFDSTLVNTVAAYLDLYNHKYNKHPGFVEAKPENHTRWDFRCVCPLLLEDAEISALFEDDLFFEYLTLMPGCTQVLSRLKEDGARIVVVTIGTPDNLCKKQKWLHHKLPFIDDFIGITNYGPSMDKTMINMAGNVFIDDYQDNLFNSNAARRILFKHEGRVFDWNKDWKGEIIKTWGELT